MFFSRTAPVPAVDARARQAENLKSLDESISPRLLDVERKSVKNVAELLGELVEGNKQVTASTDKNTREIVKELAAIRSAMGTCACRAELSVPLCFSWRRRRRRRRRVGGIRGDGGQKHAAWAILCIS